MVEEARVNRDQGPERGATIRFDQIEKRRGFAVVAAGTRRLEFHQAPELFGAAGILQIVDGDAEPGEVFGREIDASERGVFADVAQDVRQLEGDAAFFGQRQSFRRGEAEDVNGGEADDRGDPIAIPIKLVEGFDGAGIEVGGDAFNHVVEVLVRDAVALDCIEKRGPGGIVVRGDRPGPR